MFTWFFVDYLDMRSDYIAFELRYRAEDPGTRGSSQRFDKNHKNSRLNKGRENNKNQGLDKYDTKR